MDLGLCCFASPCIWEYLHYRFILVTISMAAFSSLFWFKSYSRKVTGGNESLNTLVYRHTYTHNLWKERVLTFEKLMVVLDSVGLLFTKTQRMQKTRLTDGLDWWNTHRETKINKGLIMTSCAVIMCNMAADFLCGPFHRVRYFSVTS